MKRLFLILACALPAGLAHGQSFQTALPLDATDRQVVESRLPTILEFTPPGEVQRFRLPSGRILAVRPYLPVRGADARPCRGYRIDLLGDSGSMAVDGFRCRRSDGDTWAIVEPEIVLAQDGAPLDLRGSGEATETPPPDGIEIAAEEPDAARTTSGFFAQGETTPVPRPAPRPATALAGPAGGSEDAPPAADAPVPDAQSTGPGAVAAAPLAPLGADGDGPLDPRIASPATPEGDDGAETAPARPLVRLPGDLPASDPSDDDTPAAIPDGSVIDTSRVADTVRGAGETVREAGEEAAARVVGQRPSALPVGFAQDPRVLGALRELAYLEAGGARPSDASVSRAIDSFARDERFALPVSSETLIGHLNEAIERRTRLPACGPSTADTLCLVRN